jgi:hypothetical protein
MKKSVVFIGACAIAAYLLYSKSNFAKSANFSFEKMQPDLKKKKITIYLGVANPTGQQLTIKSIVGNLIVNGTTVASIENFADTVISPTKKTLIKLELIPSATGILSQVTTLVKSFLNKSKTKTKTTISATFKGAANLEGLTMPIDIKLIG